MVKPIGQNNMHLTKCLSFLSLLGYNLHVPLHNKMSNQICIPITFGKWCVDLALPKFKTMECCILYYDSSKYGHDKVTCSPQNIYTFASCKNKNLILRIKIISSMKSKF